MGGAQATITWDDWSPVDIDDWSGVVAHELGRLVQPVQRVPADPDAAADRLVSARAALLGSQDGAERVAASIVRTSGWPGETDIVDPIAARAVGCALGHISDIDPATDNGTRRSHPRSTTAPRRGPARLGGRPVVRNPARSRRLVADRCRDAPRGRGLAYVEHRSSGRRSRRRDAPAARFHGLIHYLRTLRSARPPAPRLRLRRDRLAERGSHTDTICARRRRSVRYWYFAIRQRPWSMTRPTGKRLYTLAKRTSAPST